MPQSVQVGTDGTGGFRSLARSPAEQWSALDRHDRVARHPQIVTDERRRLVGGDANDEVIVGNVGPSGGRHVGDDGVEADCLAGGGECGSAMALVEGQGR